MPIVIETYVIADLVAKHATTVKQADVQPDQSVPAGEPVGAETVEQDPSVGEPNE